MGRRHYRKAPITEAVIDVRLPEQDSSALDALHDLLQSETVQYPEKRQIHALEASFQAQFHVAGEQSPVASSSARNQPVGFMGVGSERRQVVQFRTNGFTLSRLAPYDRWESFRDEARRLWRVFRRVAANPPIVRVAVRYINRLDLPLAHENIDRYFRTAPRLSPDLNPAMLGMFMQVQIPYAESKAVLNLSQAVVPPVIPNTRAVVLDIDLWRTEDVPQEDEPLWASIETLHDSEGRIFEACITDEARRLFE